MEVGLLWLDDDRITGFEKKVLKAAAHYARKYGHPPNLCFVHPSALNGKGTLRAGGVEIRPGRSILPGHFWLGVADREEELG